MMNGNIPKSLRVGHQNLGSGIVSNKLSDIDLYDFCFYFNQIITGIGSQDS